jgi:DNA polymerase-3 subunit epsilon
LGVFIHKRQAEERLREIAKEYKLCVKLLGLEKGKGRCFGSQIGQCNGACVGEEPAFKHNVRFVEAFTHLRVPVWPFAGAVGISEKFEDKEELHLIYNWCYLGSVKNDNDDLQELSKKPISFDWDSYKILRRFVTKHMKSGNILNLTELDLDHHTQE